MDGYLGPRKRCKCRKFNTKRLYNSIRQGNVRKMEKRYAMRWQCM